MDDRTTALLPASPGLDPGDGSPLPLFTSGSFLDEVFVAQLLERGVAAEPARLLGFELRPLDRLRWPVLMPHRDGVVDGRVYRTLEAVDLERLDAYAGVGEGLYRRTSVEVVTARGHEPAAAFLPTGRTLGRYG